MEMSAIRRVDWNKMRASSFNPRLTSMSHGNPREILLTPVIATCNSEPKRRVEIDLITFRSLMVEVERQCSKVTVSSI
ncbi:hypothetical protein RRG08_027351 [Elysia crispata]|uniref:Uncharacterized protein n=1 Tax=Elysia crispata TaxID=231223 RepID=A0AAE1DKD1_9GAST|nr:hypothetical protein RRG08_027351 [Elysia crispata]